jgi:hypothetical protein
MARYERSVGVIILILVNAELLSFNLFIFVDVDDPVSCAKSVSSVCAPKYFFLALFTNSAVIKFPPLFVPVVFYIVEVVTAIGITFVDANSV